MIESTLDVKLIKQLRTLFVILLLIGLWLTRCAYAEIKPLPANQAFQFSAQVKDAQTLIFNWKIAPGYYLYKSRFHFKVFNSPNTKLSPPLYPEAIDKYNAELGHYAVYMNQLSLGVPILKAFDTTITVQVSYQGCAQQGFCYHPMIKNVNLNLTGNYMQSTAGTDVISPIISVAKAPAGSRQVNKLSRLLGQHNLLLIIVIFFGLGLLMSLTPCVLPMIPILSSIIVGNQSKSSWHTFSLSMVYVLGMAIAYALVGVLFGFLGASIQPFLQLPWVIILFSIVFILMGLSMLGVFQIQLPQFLRVRISDASQHQKRGTYVGVFFMGLLASIILSPCVTPPLVGVLAYISHHGSIAVGAVALFCLGLGIGAPLLVIGALGSHFLPKVGRWMLAINQVMGLLLFAVAVWLLARIIPATWGMSLWAAWIIFCAVFLGAFTTSKGVWLILRKLIGILVFIYGILVFTGIFTHSDNPFAPTQLRHTSKLSQLHFITVHSLAEIQHTLNKPVYKKQPFLLDFYADWCTSCQQLEHFTFSNPLVIKQLRKMVLLKADITHYDTAAQEMMKHYGVIAPPTLLFFDKNHHIITTATIIGGISAKELVAHLRALSN